MPVLQIVTYAAQLTVPIGDDGQLMSGGPPVLWLSTNAVQLTIPIGDDGQLMSAPLRRPARPMLSTNAVQFVLRLRRALFRSSFAFLFSVRQTFPFLFRSPFHFFRLFRSLFVLQTFPFLFIPLFRSSFRSSLLRRWGFPTAQSLEHMSIPILSFFHILNAKTYQRNIKRITYASENPTA